MQRYLLAVGVCIVKHRSFVNDGLYFILAYIRRYSVCAKLAINIRIHHYVLSPLVIVQVSLNTALTLV